MDTRLSTEGLNAMLTRRRTWDPGSWPARTDRPRVLVEDPDGAVRDAMRRLLEREGFDVALCSGPQDMGRRECPAVRGEGCALAAGADVVYTSLADADTQSREVVGALRTLYPDTPLVTEIPQPKHRELAESLDGCHVTYVPVGRHEMTAAIRAALDGRSA